MSEKDLEIQNLKRKLKIAEKKLEYVRNFVEVNCVYDEHLMGYCLDLPKGKVRTMMYNLNKEDKYEETK